MASEKRELTPEAEAQTARRQKHIATALGVIAGLVGLSFAMIGAFSNIAVPSRVLFLAIGAAAMLAAPFATLGVLRLPRRGRFLKLLLTVDKVIETNLVKRFSSIYDFVFAGVKCAAAIVAGSMFFIASALTSACFGFAKRFYLNGIRKADGDIAKDYLYFGKIAVCILLGGLVYAAYTARFFVVPASFRYGRVLGIGIAAVSFTEFIFAIKNLFTTKSVLSTAVRLQSLASSLMALALTEVALTSFSATGSPSLMNAVTGVVFGGITALIGVAMLLRYLFFRIKQKNTVE